MNLDVKDLLIGIALLLFLIMVELGRIESRLREHFPTRKEADRDARRHEAGVD